MRPQNRSASSTAVPRQAGLSIRELNESIGECMIIDRRTLRERLNALERRLRHGRAIDQSLTRLSEEIARSKDRRARREQSRPAASWPIDLPIVSRRGEIAAAIAKHQVVIVCGETGSGKTTQLPKICLELGRGAAGMIGHTQPRRIAARSVGRRIAEELNVPFGHEIGVKVRFGDQTSERTLVKLMTDGILLAETQSDHLLERYDTIIIDEAHERSLNIDFLIGYLKRLLPRRPDLKLIITSATIDPESFSRHFDGAPILEVSGRAYPVDIWYSPLASDDPDEADQNVEESILATVSELGVEGPGDVLIFLSGEREIRETAEALRKRAPAGTEILPLYARLSWNEQQRIFQPHQGRRIVLATNVAETSLTVPGIRYVIDPGLARISRYSARARVQRLPIEPISQASANQRAGRCGRIGPGVCVRLYSEDDFRKRDEFTPPEILRTNLASVILQMKALKLGEVEEFPFLEPPRRTMIREGYETLHELGAIDDENRLTKIGEELARLPVDPRIGRMVLAGVDEHCLREALIIASALSIQDPRERPMDKREASDAAHERYRDDTSDFLGFVKLWEFYHEQKAKLSHSQLRKMCRQNFLSYLRLREWSDVYRQIKEVCVTERRWPLNSSPAEGAPIHRAILTGLLNNVGLRTDAHEYTGAWNRKFHIFPGSYLFQSSPKWIMAAEIVETTKLYARTVARIQPEWVERIGAHLLKHHYSEPHWQEEGAFVAAWEKATLYGLEIVPKRRVNYGPIDPAASRVIFIHHALVLGEYRTTAPFMRHNRAVVAEIEAMEAKSRRRDLLKSPEERFAFFDARVPNDVYSGPTFEKWRKTAEREDSQLLFMRRSDAMREVEGPAPREQYPERMTIGSTVLPLEYAHDPGAMWDGVTVTVPVEALGQLSEDRLSWLVPGMLEEKIIALLKSLPKSLRTCFLPASDYAARLAAALPERPNGSLLDAMGNELYQLTGVEVPHDAWRPDAIPGHLHMNIRVVDDRGKKLAVGRDLGELRRRLGSKIQASFAGAAERDFQRDGIRKWDIGALPGRVEIKRSGVRMIGYPALVDSGEDSSLRLFDSEYSAGVEHHFGLRRLFILQVRGELEYQIDHLSSLNAMRMKYATLGDAAELRSELIELLADRALFSDRDGDGPVRDERTFERRVTQGWKRIGAASREVATLVASVLDLYHRVDLRLAEEPPPAWAASIADIDEQIGFLVKKRFLSRTPWNWLTQYPRYFAAIERRLDKLAGGGLDRDARLLCDLRQRWTAWLARAERRRAEHTLDPELDRYRWMLEEYRVSLFAQELGTVIPVSEKRLDRQWSLTRE